MLRTSALGGPTLLSVLGLFHNYSTWIVPFYQLGTGSVAVLTTRNKKIRNLEPKKRFFSTNSDNIQEHVRFKEREDNSGDTQWTAELFFMLSGE